MNLSQLLGLVGVEAKIREEALAEGPVVVKAAGLAGGKGAIVCEDRRSALEALDRLMGERIFGSAGERS